MMRRWIHCHDHVGDIDTELPYMPTTYIKGPPSPPFFLNDFSTFTLRIVPNERLFFRSTRLSTVTHMSEPLRNNVTNCTHSVRCMW